MNPKKSAAVALAAALLVAGTYRVAAATKDGAAKEENDDLKGLVSDLRDVCYAQADRLYGLADKPDLAVPEELNLMQAKTLAGTWLENCREIAPEDVEAVTNVFAVADITLDRATDAYQAATKKDKK